MNANKLLLSVAIVFLSMCSLAAGVSAQSVGSAQKMTSKGWTTAVAGDIHTGNFLYTAVEGETEYYVLMTDGQDVFRIKKDDVSISKEEADALQEALRNRGGVSVAVDAPAGIQSVTVL